MLSVTHSISDVKTKLIKPYTHFNYESDEEFVNALTAVFEDTELTKMYPMIGEDYYSEIQSKDKSDLDLNEKYIYFAEVYYTCCLFLDKWNSAENSKDNGKSVSLNVEGYSASESGNSGDPLFNKSKKSYYDMAVEYSCLAGYNPHQIQRGGGLFGRGNSIYSESVK